MPHLVQAQAFCDRSWPRQPDSGFQMLDRTTSVPGSWLGAMVHHGDAGRDYPYDHKSPAGSTAAGGCATLRRSDG